MKHLRPKLTFANVVSCLALFVALSSGAVAASQLGKNSVGPKQLKKNAVTTAKIKNEAVTGAKINSSTLGTVPSAANAQSLGGLSAAQIEQGSKLRCPSGTEPAGGVCFEIAARPAATYEGALKTCASVDRRLPTMGEAATFLLEQTNNSENWAGSQYLNGATFFAPTVSGDSKGLVLGGANISLDSEFRCVTNAGN